METGEASRFLSAGFLTCSNAPTEQLRAVQGGVDTEVSAQHRQNQSRLARLRFPVGPRTCAAAAFLDAHQTLAAQLEPSDKAGGGGGGSGCGYWESGLAEDER